ncbi:refilin-B [Sphaerodactylus townsendi]|uniref:refilin-B n=1 Tax=Sphaerodactylus townsendi TaxID=933632 RepID=UPI0020263DD4|nr:refilin-B [Sphaerodactylus townsendi]
MVGRLSLQEVPDLPDAKRRGERPLDSPDSGLPPSPSPAHWLPASAERGGLANGLLHEPAGAAGGTRVPATNSSSPNPLLPGSTSRLCLLSFGEGVEFDPLPPKDVRYTSSVKYDSEKHFINNVYLPMGLGMTSCSQTVVCVPDSTWRSYKAELHLEPRPKPRHFTSTAIVYPKHTKTVYTTTLDYNCKKVVRRFLSSVELESAERSGSNYNPEDC